MGKLNLLFLILSLIVHLYVLSRTAPYFLLYVDEAHTFGFYGDEGRGYCNALGVLDEVDFLMSTLSKATATIGGFVAMDETFHAYITSCSRAYMFQASIPPLDAALTLASLEILKTDPAPAKRLHDNNRYFRDKLKANGFDLGESQSPVVPVFIPEYKKLFAINKGLYENGIFTVAITWPAVGKSEGRLRFIVNATHTQEDIDTTVRVLTELCKKHGVLS